MTGLSLGDSEMFKDVPRCSQMFPARAMARAGLAASRVPRASGGSCAGRIAGCGRYGLAQGENSIRRAGTEPWGGSGEQQGSRKTRENWDGWRENGN